MNTEQSAIKVYNSFADPSTYKLDNQESIKNYIDKKIKTIEDIYLTKNIEEITILASSVMHAINDNKNTFVAEKCSRFIKDFIHIANFVNTELYNNKNIFVRVFEYFISFFFTPNPTCLDSAIYSIGKLHSTIAIQSIIGNGSDGQLLDAINSYISGRITKGDLDKNIEFHSKAIETFSKSEKNNLIKLLTDDLNEKLKQHTSNIENQIHELFTTKKISTQILTKNDIVLKELRAIKNLHLHDKNTRKSNLELFKNKHIHYTALLTLYSTIDIERNINNIRECISRIKDVLHGSSESNAKT